MTTSTDMTLNLSQRLVKRFRDRAFKKNIDREDGNSIVIWVMMAPVLFGAFGCSVDLAIGTYMNTALQSGLETSVQTTLASSSNQGSTGKYVASPRLELQEAKDEYRRIYDFNRRMDASANEAPTLICQTSKTAGISGTLQQGGSGCPWTEEKFAYVRTSGGVTTLDVEVFEKSRPMFIQILGFEQIKYHLNGSARLTTSFVDEDAR